jgi:hypothetical protein
VAQALLPVHAKTGNRLLVCKFERGFRIRQGTLSSVPHAVENKDGFSR